MTAHLVDLEHLDTVDVLGPTLGYITALDDATPCVLRGEIPPGGVVPLHSHADPETFVLLSGGVEGLTDMGWVRFGPGEVFHVPGNARHAFRNPSDEPAVMIIATTARIGRFFREVARLIDETAEGDPDAALWVFIDAADRHGHWIAGPEENADVGLLVG